MYYDNEVLKQFSELDGVPGYEREVFDYMSAKLDGKVASIQKDNLGSFISKQDDNAQGPKLMLAAHMDEVGFIVKRIDDNGFVFFAPAGGWVTSVMLSQKVVITTDSGKKITGVTGSKPPHIVSAEERTKAVDFDKIHIDLGTSSKEETESLGVNVGDMITPKFDFEVLNNENYLLGKAWDNRIGCAIVANVMENLSGEKLPNQLYGVATVQEEVGLRGAKTSANKVQPDVAIAVDTGIAGDTPFITVDEANNKIGDGPLLFVVDASMLSHVGLRKYIMNIAKEIGVPVQLEFLKAGGQDGGSIHVANEGCPTVAISIATRYIHSHSSIIHRKDFEGAVKLLTEVARRLDNDALELIKA